MRQELISTLLFLVFCQSLHGQFLDDPPYYQDSILSYDTYLNLVKAYHPFSQNADMQVELAERTLRMARSGFDPRLYGNYRLKEYSNINYYNALQAGVEIPTWFGLSFQAGYEDNSGVFLNPEATTPVRGLINAGVTAQVGAGLLMDQRRADLRKGEIGLNQGVIDRQLLLNDLFYESTLAYLDWVYADQSLAVAENALKLASERYEAVRLSFQFGDLPAIDTAEAYTQVLSRLNLLREAQSDWIESINMASVFLWDNDGNDIQIAPGIYPDWPPLVMSETFPLQDIPIAHPALGKIRNKQAEFDIDRRLAAESLRPKLELKYNFLTENISPAPAEEYFQNNGFFENNFNFGAKLSYPLFLREARGKLGMAKVKFDMAEQELLQKRAALEAKLGALRIKRDNLIDQIAFAEENVRLLNRLVEGEIVLFDNGESSLFLINSREMKAIDAQFKLFELRAKAKAADAEIRRVRGLGFPE